MSEFKEKESIAKYVSSKFDYELYHDEDNKKHVVVRIKSLFDKKTKTTKFRFFENTKNTITLSSEELNEKQIKFIQSVEGVNYCLAEYKKGSKTKNSILEKINLKLE